MLCLSIVIQFQMNEILIFPIKKKGIVFSCKQIQKKKRLLSWKEASWIFIILQ